MQKVNPIIRWWVTPKLPKVHVFIPKEQRPEGLYQIARVYFRKWVVHPIKRRIAKYYLILLKRFFGITVIGITGSAGKTTTKEMVAAILKQEGKTVCSFANIDPVYNIPTTILSCRASTRFLILEMGVEYPKEMDFYLWLAKPHIGVITNIYPTHTEFLGSEEGVFREKRKLAEALEKGEFAILNRNNKFLKSLDKKLKANVIWFGDDTQIYAKNLEFNIESGTDFTLVIDSNSIRVHLPILGQQFVENALAAVSVGYVLGISIEDIKKGIESFAPPEHRMRPLKLPNGAIIIDDSYNNNPKAAEESLKTFEEVSRGKKKIVVFGDMLELGSLEKKSHKEMGEVIAKLKPYYLLCVGPASKTTADIVQKGSGDTKVDWVEKAGEVSHLLKPLLYKNTVTLIKGSRSIGLDKIVDAIK